MYVFQQAIKTIVGYKISPSKHIIYTIIAAQIKRISQILRFEYSTIAYSLRYNAGNKFDENSLSHPLIKISYANSLMQLILVLRYETSLQATLTQIHSANITSDAISTSISRGFSEAKSCSKHLSSRPAALATLSVSANQQI